MARENPVAPFRTEELLIQRTWLYALAARLVRDQAECDDLVQETWLAALQHPRGEERRDLRQWLGAVLRNRWRFARRSDARRRAREQGRGERESSTAPVDLVEQAELQGVLVRAVLALEEPYRSTVLRRYFGERTCRAIAREEGVPEGTVRSRLKRALDLLRAELDRANGGERRAWILALVPLARLVRTKPALTTVGAVTTAAIGILALGWSWMRGDERAPLELSVAASEPSSPQTLAPPSPALAERAALAVETSGAAASLPLAAAGRLELLVLDPDGRPIPDASVACGIEERQRSLRTSEHGTCRIPNDAWSSASLELEVTAPGFVRHDAPIDRGAFSWSSPYPITLPVAVALEGRLRDADTGQAIEGGELTLLYGYRGAPLARATSGADGAFRLEPAPRGWEVELWIRAPGYPASHRLVQVSSTERAVLELALSSGVELRGRIVDAWTGAPLAGVRALHDHDQFGYGFGAPSDRSIELARSDPGGEIVVRTSAQGEESDVLFFHTGYCSVRLNPGTDGFEVPLLAVGVVEGIVRDAEGHPMESSEVTLDGMWRETRFEKLSLNVAPDSPLARLGNASLFAPVWRAKTDELGRFRLEVVPGYPRAQLQLQGPRHAVEHWTLEPPLRPGQTRHAEITVQGAGTIAGLLRINGEPSPGRVQCLSQGKVVASDWARPDGTFEIRGVSPGAVLLQASPDEHDRYTPHSGHTHDVLAEVEVVAGAEQRVELDLALTMGTIRGRVTSPSGQPRAYTSVLARAGRGNGTWRAVTDVQGAFELRVPAEEESYELEVQGCATTPARVNADDIELVSVGYGRIRLRAEDAASHQVLERVTLYVRRAGPGWESVGQFSAGTDGFAQWELEAGAFELAVHKADNGYPCVFLGGVTLAENEDLELEAVLERVAPVEFVLTNPPLPGVCILRLENASGLPAKSSFFESGSPRVDIRFRDGRASVPSLAPGAYRVSASFPDVVVEPGEVRIGSDRSRAIELTWQRGN